MRVTIEDVLEATGGKLAGGTSPGSDSVTSFHTDSREAVPGGLFFALRGESMDGHSFVRDALGRGAVAAVVERPVSGVQLAQVVVPDTWQALYALAAWVLRRVDPLVIGITGSNGKTSTKELTAAALSAGLDVHRNEGNLNTETGLPLTILSLQPSSQALVVELGIQKPGDMSRLVELARPRAGIVTNIGSVHVEYFGSVDGIAREKGRLVSALPGDGLAVLNADDPYLPVLEGMASAPVRTFGIDGGDMRAEEYQALPDGGASFSAQGVAVRLAMGGRHQVRNALAALTVAGFAGVPLDRAAARLTEVRVEHRMQRIATPAGFEVIDDAYNASPESMLAAFEAIRELPLTGRRLAVLGEMRELGPLADDQHRRVGSRAADVFDAIAVVDVGRGRILAEAARAELVGTDDAAAWVRSQATPGSVVLVKASNGLALGAVVKQLLAPESQPA